jgi:2,5-diketo-D-gluconate reductase B
MMLHLSAHGLTMPAIGLGTSKLGDCAEIVATALRCGYRLFDTARKYGTEEGVGEAIRHGGVPRSEIIVSTKVSHEDLRPADFARSVDASLAALALDYVDLLLVNWPNPQIALADTMTAMANAKRRGLARHLGVCNFNIAMIREAVHLCPEPLAVLQAEYHPYLDQSPLLAACREAGLIFMAYCTVRHKRLFDNPVISDIARDKGKSNAQIALRWLMQQGNIAAIPRSANPRHIAENIDIFDFALSDDEMKKLSVLTRADGRLSSPAGLAPVWD